MQEQEIKKLFTKFNTIKVLIIGDVMIDTYFWGKVNRISPEAPVPIIARTDIEHRLGGAANVARNIKALGAEAILCSVIGNDEKGKILLELMQSKNLSVQGIIQTNSRITTTKTRIISNNQHLLRIDEEISKVLDNRLEHQLIDKIKNIMSNKQPDAIIFQDYDKGVISKTLIETVVEIANNNKIPTLVDPKKRNFTNYRNVSLFKPNFKELIEGLKLEISKKDTKAIHAAAQKFRKKYNIEILMTTLSELGVYISDKEDYHKISAEIRDVADVSGAGDTVISTASLCLASGLSPFQIAWISNIAGGLVCEKSGVVPVNKEQLLDECIGLARTT